jgi:undecaprenyl-phosphate 4-deoxy-4-formamido-L-arabinose transferase
MIEDPTVDLSIVIPAYHSEKTLPMLMQRLYKVLEGMGKSYEVVVVDDGSQDGTWSVLSRLQTEHQQTLTAVQLMRNFGQHNALMCGLRHARGELIVTMDDDLQNPPEEIPALVKAMQEGDYDLVYGKYDRKRHGRWRNLGSTVVNIFYRWVFHLTVTVTAFRVMRRQLAQSILSYDLNFTFLDGLLAWNTQRIGAVPVRHEPRQDGRSGYSLRRLVLLAMNLFANFSLLPLQLVSLLGFLFSLVGFALGILYLVKYFLDQLVVPGYASTIVAILILGGTQLLALGVIGEYLGRLHLNVNRKPQYTVRKTMNSET